MKFDLKRYNTSGLNYVDDGQILPTKIKDNKIQVRASKMINGKRQQSKKTLTFAVTVTLLDAIKESSKVYDKLFF